MGAAIATIDQKREKTFCSSIVYAFYSQTSRFGSRERNFHPMRRSSLLWMRILKTSKRDQKI